jgi:hypothetical protein
MGVFRAAFAIDADGGSQGLPKVSPKTHDGVMLKALAEPAGRAAMASSS